MTQQREKRTAAEWFTFAVSSAIVLAVVALIAGQMFDGHSPPSISARAMGSVTEKAGRFYVPVEVVNHGDETAANVQITVELTVDGETVTEGDQSIDFLPGGDTDTLVFVVDDDPEEGELDVQVAGYAEP